METTAKLLKLLEGSSNRNARAHNPLANECFGHCIVAESPIAASISSPYGWRLRHSTSRPHYHPRSDRSRFVGRALHARRHFADHGALFFHRRGCRHDVLVHALNRLIDGFKYSDDVAGDSVQTFDFRTDSVGGLLCLSGNTLDLGCDNGESTKSALSRSAALSSGLGSFCRLRKAAPTSRMGESICSEIDRL